MMSRSCGSNKTAQDTARATIDLLKDTFGDRLISRFGPVNWPQDLVKSESEPHETGNVIEVVDLARQINSEVYIDDVQELLDSNNQELTIDELVEMNISRTIH
ncbi:hypothetical protein TNCV_3720831 [Trichonephila clavipes]|nr:hypothetical protein TNCV_3720831 [Trichonephila clavipes]